MSPKYNISVNDEGDSVITMVIDGETITVTEESENFQAIAKALVEGGDPTQFLLARHITEGTPFEYDEISDEVRWGDGEDAEPVPTPVVSGLKRYRLEGRDAGAIGRFMELVKTNPSRRSREQLMNWLDRHGLKIDTEGYIIGFKAVRALSDDTKASTGYAFESINSGVAYVDGVRQDGHIRQAIGSVVSMPRTEVMDDPDVECSHGLHVGTWEYAEHFGDVGGPILEVKIDPADVVSVPKHDWTKMRCCRYTVLAIHDREKQDDVRSYEPEATHEPVTPETFEDAVRIVIPDKFVDRLITRIFGKKKSEEED